MIDTIGGIIAVDDAVAVAIGGDTTGNRARRGRRGGGDFFLVRTGCEQQRGRACEHKRLETHRSLSLGL
jgi:hypothetical protein